MSQVMVHVRELAEALGPRPATTDVEAQAADYIEDVFKSRGLEVERQEFFCPRTTSWAFVIYYLLAITAAVISKWQPLVAVALGALVAALLWLEVSGRSSLSALMPKGPSQNVIARHVPRQRRGDRLRKVLIVAHYDSAKASLAYSPALVRRLGLARTARAVAIAATPVLALVAAMPFAKTWQPWLWYVTLAVGAYLLVPLVVTVHKELLMPATEGANDNASGVAAMFAVAEAIIAEPDETSARTQPLRHGPAAAYDADVVIEDALLEYRRVGEAAIDEEPVEVPAPREEAQPFNGLGDVSWETGPLTSAAPAPTVAPVPPAPVSPAPAAAPSFAPAVPEVPEPELPLAERIPEVAPTQRAPMAGDWAEDEADWEEPPPVRRTGRLTAPPDSDELATIGDDGGNLGTGPIARRPADLPQVRRDEAVSAPRRDEPAEEEEGPGPGQEQLDLPEDEPKRRGKHDESKGIRDWLGIGKSFDVRKAGKELRNWENIDDDDEFGFKAGTAGELDWTPTGGLSDEAARIRRRVTESVDRALAEKEIWFVATGAHEAGGWGMRALLDAYDDELADAHIINIDAVGAGTLAYVTEEGRTRHYRSDRRLLSQAKRTSRENNLQVKGQAQRGQMTDAAFALARGHKAMTVRAFDINERVPEWHWHSDTIENVSEQAIEQAAAFVTALVREL